ncbi:MULTISPECIES: nuclear transport factor 2 family protein [unclassified Streptomyces]|uniref:nuclear transport factor 2 family protein n=1 Tax=unclassified Streptomyces TaxID=2593676 RepID=UPI0036E7353E
MDPIERLLAERACERLIVDLVRRLDLGEPGSVAELFTEDGCWEWPSPGGDARRFQGRAALREYFGSRPGGRLSRRVMSNILVTVDSADTASATSYFTTYRVDGHAGGTTPIPSGPPVQVGHYEDTFRRTANGSWLLASRVLHLPFGGPTPRATGASG